MPEFSITGTPTGGLGWATTTVALQKPLMEPYLPELSGCHPATINLRLETNLRIEKADVVTPPLDWSVDWKEKRMPPERFWLTRMEFEVVGKTGRILGWIYDAEFSPHRPNPWFVEFLAPFTAHEKTDTFRLYFQREMRTESLVYLT